MSKFKTKWEYEKEDSINHQKRLENLQRRRDLKRAEGFKCKFDGCEEHFEAKFEFDAHIKKHQDECFKAMRCNKDQCKDIKVSVPPNEHLLSWLKSKLNCLKIAVQKP